MRDAAPVGGWGFKVAEESWLLCSVGGLGWWGVAPEGQSQEGVSRKAGPGGWRGVHWREGQEPGAFLTEVSNPPS